MDRAEKILLDNIDILHRLANVLLEREILDGDEIDKLIRGEELPPLEPRKNGQNQLSKANTDGPAPQPARG